MASESSSAVLELNDADGTDTEVGSVTDDREGTPLIMETGMDIAVKVDAPMKQLSTMETFVTYRVRCVCGRWPCPPYTRRRFNHFKLLHKRLSSSYPLVAVPPLPPLHSARQQLDRYSPSFVAIRTLALDTFLQRISKHPILTHDEDLRLFLTTPDDELDKVFKSDSSAMNLWGLSLYSDKQATNGARVRDPEFVAAAEYMQSLQQKLTTLCSITEKLYSGGTKLSSEYSSMRRACDAWSSGVGGAAARAAGALAAGCGRAAAARAGAPLRYRATLPLLADYARAHLDKIRARDALHAAHVAGNSSDDLHNKLEQASEALRSELGDWIPKTRAEIKSILLDLADKQVAIHSQSLLGWEYALKLSTEADVTQMFKTVSKTAVQNLSPSKCQSFDVETDSDDDKTSGRYSLGDERIKSELNGDRVSTCDDTSGDKTGVSDKVIDTVESVFEKTSVTDDSECVKISDPLQDFSDVELS
ncbi:sorting nexin-7-like [Leptidea sinapis]|uniref:sorting nexin-7-like n=1 Tax=Leptidea sinapis TaxID=189913 RepID=UPI0021352D99|nr:sorting nexin-7-like [Leptidea sinapis]